MKKYEVIYSCNTNSMLIVSDDGSANITGSDAELIVNILDILLSGGEIPVDLKPLSYKHD